MRRHVLTRGRLVGVRSVTDGICAPAVTDALLTIATDGDEHDLTVTPDVAAAIAADQLLFADVEVCLTRAGETTPADGERARYLAASADVARLERALATAESARDRHHLRARLLADGILDVAAGRPLDARLDGIDADNLRALAAHLDAQRPHGPAADVELRRQALDDAANACSRVVLSYGAAQFARIGAERCLDAVIALRDSVRAVEPVDAQNGVGEQRGEGVGQSVGVEHGASVATDGGDGELGAR